MDTNLGQVVLVKDINTNVFDYEFPLAGNSSPGSLTEFNDKLYFSASDGENGNELWVSDGTAGGTQLVADIQPGDTNYGEPDGSSPRELFEFDDKLYFSASVEESGRELWVSDGTAEGTQLLIEINPTESNAGTAFAFPASSSPSDFAELNGKLYFSANDGTNGEELWVSDGSASGTQLLADIQPGFGTYDTGVGIFTRPYSSRPGNLIELNDKLYFSADDGETGQELWVSDGTAQGTQLLADISPDVNRSYQYDYLDGSRPRNLVEFQDKLYFSANDDENGRELWVSDGTTEGTQLLIDINPGSNSYRYGRPGNYYYADYPARSNPSDFAEFNDKLYFAARNNDTGRELWVTDGTAEGTQLFADINPEGDSAPTDLVEFNGKLYFTADDGENGRELWVSDGTAQGTQLVADIKPGTNDNDPYNDNGSNPSNLTVVGNELFFTADNGETGKELFKLTAEDLTDGMPIAIDGSDGSDNLFGGNNAEQINALSGQDTVDSGAGNDTVDGGDGDDRLISLSGNNSLIGGNGNDTIEAGEGNDTLTGGNGSDVLKGGGGSDSLSGGEDNDFLDGGAGHDTLTGDNGDDRLLGGADNDLLIGGAGNDFLDGGAGHDTLQGDGGDDVFVLRTGAGTDTILDFNLGGDRLGLSDGLQFGDLSFSGHTILAGEEVLANLNGVNTEELTASDFREI